MTYQIKFSSLSKETYKLHPNDKPFKIIDLVIIKDDIHYPIRCTTKELQDFLTYDILNPPDSRPRYYNSDNLLVYWPKPERPGLVSLRTYEGIGEPWIEFTLPDPIKFQIEIRNILDNVLS